jgi:hypothetical protein
VPASVFRWQKLGDRAPLCDALLEPNRVYPYHGYHAFQEEFDVRSERHSSNKKQGGIA